MSIKEIIAFIRKELRQSLLVAFWFMLLTFPIMVIKVNPLEKTIQSFKEVLEGKHDDVPEQAFYMVGSIDDVLAKAKTLKERP